MSTVRALLAAILILSSPGAALAQPAAAPPLAPLAHSALLAVDAAPAAGGLMLRVRHPTGETPLQASEVAVTIDGKSEPATLRADGTWFVPRPANARDNGKTLQVTVGHDGIHEVLSGRLVVPAGAPGSRAWSPTSALSSTHKQLAWWILNIVIVLIAAIAISRRMS